MLRVYGKNAGFIRRIQKRSENEKMNYTAYILKKQPVNPSLLISDKRVLHEMTVLASLPVAAVGILVVAGLVPGAWLIDLTRLAKLRRYQYLAKKRRQAYVRCVLLSLDHRVDRYTVQLLMTA